MHDYSKVRVAPAQSNVANDVSDKSNIATLKDIDPVALTFMYGVASHADPL